MNENVKESEKTCAVVRKKTCENLREWAKIYEDVEATAVRKKARENENRVEIMALEEQMSVLMVEKACIDDNMLMIKPYL